MTRTSENGIRYYEAEGLKFPSVTSILKEGYPKPFLQDWYAKETATWIAANIAEFILACADDKKSAIEHAKEAAIRKAKISSDRGTLVHKLIECCHTGEVKPKATKTEMGYFAGFESWVTEYKPQFLYSEVELISVGKRFPVELPDGFGYGGSADAIVDINGLTYLVDYKTSRNWSPEMALQIVGYTHADFIVDPVNKLFPFPEIDKGAILKLGGNGMFEFYEIDPYEPELENTFLSVYDVASYRMKYAS